MANSRVTGAGFIILAACLALIVYFFFAEKGSQASTISAITEQNSQTAAKSNAPSKSGNPKETGGNSVDKNSPEKITGSPAAENSQANDRSKNKNSAQGDNRSGNSNPAKGNNGSKNGDTAGRSNRSNKGNKQEKEKPENNSQADSGDYPLDNKIYRIGN